MTLSPGAKVQPKRSTLRSPAGFSAACSSMLSERAPTPPRFIGQSTWMSRIGFKAFGDAGLHQFQDALNGGLGIFGRNEVEIALSGRSAKTGHRALIDAMGVDNDSARGGLPEHLGQSHYGHSARADDVGQHLPRSDGWQLVDIADDEQRRIIWRRLQ